MSWNLEFLIGETKATVMADPESSVLDQALAQGVDISFACKRGDCGQCVGTLIAGEVAPIEPARPCIRDREVFLCNAAARSDAVLRLPHFPETRHLRVQRSPGKIHALNRLSADVIEMVLRLPPNTDFNFLPGQYIRVTNKSGVTRSYSLAAPPAADKLLRLHVRCMAGGAFSEYLRSSAAVGQLLHLQGPMGHFFLRDGLLAAQTICLATGTGIAPIHALLAGLDDAQRQRCGEIHVYWGNRHVRDAYLMDGLSALERGLGAKIHAVFSKEADAAQDARHVQDAMGRHHSVLHDAQVFACGNPAMIDAARQRCLALGLPLQRFISDPFTTS